MNQCAVCDKTTGLLNCSACHGIAYCGKEHQRAHWAVHKPTCQLLAAAAPKGYHKIITTPGTGKLPRKKATVFVNYKGYFPSGKVFDQSKGEPLSFQLNKREVIRGWDEAVATMKVGEKATFYIKPEYAYGATGSPPAIPPNQPLIFDVEMVKFT
ncbi:FK506-binding protein [Pelomyxa schiedti]|nr:FK506-binding protein [Pelomyxa schiedti]